MGRIIDKYGSKRACFMNVFAMMLVMTSSIFTVKNLTFNWLSYVTCGLWGFQDGVVNTHTFNMLGFEFESQNEPFAIFCLVQGVSVFIF